MTYIRFPWAIANTDKIEPPAEEQTDNSVSYQEGYSSVYSEDPSTSATAKRIERNEYNGAHFRYSSEIQRLQQQGLPDFITSAENGGAAYPYEINAVIRQPTNNRIYKSLIDNNLTVPPSTNNWLDISDLLTEITGINGINVSGTGSSREISPPPFRTQQLFKNGGAATWTKPTGCRYIIVRMVGGGGGGSGNNTSLNRPGPGGGAGEYVEFELDVTAIASLPINVGFGGLGGTQGNNGDPGNNTTMSTRIAHGGLGGSNSTLQGGIGGFTPSPSANDIISAGGDGQSLTSGLNVSGHGGDSFFGGGAKGLPSNTSAPGNSGRAIGSGGAGGPQSPTSTARSGGNGADGIIIVEEYY